MLASCLDEIITFVVETGIDSELTAELWGSAYLATSYCGLCLELETNYAMDLYYFDQYLLVISSDFIVLCTTLLSHFFILCLAFNHCELNIYAINTKYVSLALVVHSLSLIK